MSECFVNDLLQKACVTPAHRRRAKQQTGQSDICREELILKKVPILL